MFAFEFSTALKGKFQSTLKCNLGNAYRIIAYLISTSIFYTDIAVVLYSTPNNFLLAILRSLSWILYQDTLLHTILRVGLSGKGAGLHGPKDF